MKALYNYDVRLTWNIFVGSALNDNLSIVYTTKIY